MTIVKELNELAKKMTGTNPKATTDAQAMDFIEQNYNGGGSGTGAYVLDITNIFLNTQPAQELELLDRTLVEELITKLKANPNAPVVLKLTGEDMTSTYNALTCTLRTDDSLQISAIMQVDTDVFEIFTLDKTVIDGVTSYKYFIDDYDLSSLLIEG